MKDKQELAAPRIREKAHQKEGWKQEGICYLPTLGEVADTLQAGDEAGEVERSPKKGPATLGATDKI